MNQWSQSETFILLSTFVQNHLDHPTLCSDMDNSLQAYFNYLNEYCCKSFESLVFNDARYGSKAFREFIKTAENTARSMLCEYKSLNCLISAFGNPIRLDYGTGHELQFILFLSYNPQIPFSFYDSLAAYLKFQRRLIKIFRLEPAGSKGVWGLDDYFFAPYLFGAAQLVEFPLCTPEEAIMKRWDKEGYLYLWALDCIQDDKGPRFTEHSPMLWDISGLPSWTKLRDGLFKMYQKDVLQNPKIFQTFFPQ